MVKPGAVLAKVSSSNLLAASPRKIAAGRLLQPENASPMKVTLLGIVTEVRPLQPVNASRPPRTY